MEYKIIPGFSCLEFKWKTQSEIYEKTKHMTVEEQIAFFRKAAETGPFAELFRTSTNRPSQLEGAGSEPASKPSVRR